MSQLKRNILANYLGQGWASVMGLVFIPLYIQYLGMEAYGLIGLFAVMQTWLSLLDMGMTPTLNREMARFTAGAHSPQSICDLLRSLEIFCFSLAVLIGLGILAASGYLASDWLKAEKLPTAVVAQALSIMAFVIALRFVEGIYRSSLFGLQRQVWYNGANALIATLRHGGAVAVLAWVSPTVQAFFLWQVIISLLSVSVYAATVHRALPDPALPPRFSREALTGVWQFAGGMMGITLLALLLTQVDKVILSRMLTLETFGYYVLAQSIAGVIYTVIGPVSAAIFPRLVELTTQDDQPGLVSVYHQISQLITVLTAPAVMLLSIYPRGIVFMWSGNSSLAENTALVLQVYVVGIFLNGLMRMPYLCQLAHGWTSLTLVVNSVAVALLVPAMFFVVPYYGAVGAAWIWVALNIGYVLVDIYFMHRRLLPAEKIHWYFFDVLLPTGAAFGIVMLAQQFQPASYKNRLHWFIFLMSTGILSLVATTAFANRVRSRLLTIIGQFLQGHTPELKGAGN